MGQSSLHVLKRSRAPRNVAHCTEVGCELVGEHCVRTTHAEANAVVQGALYGVSLEGATAYCTHQPCISCAKLLISAGIERIVYELAYPDLFAQKMLAEAGVALVAFASLERTRANAGTS